MDSDPVYEVDEATFEQDVIERSREVTVMVDFWADWCGPCRQLTPILERLVRQEFSGQVVLAKIDTDRNQALAERYRIRGIPAVKVFRDGVIAGEFVGALPESQIAEILSSLEPSEADRLVAEAEDCAAASDDAGALARLRAAVATDPRHGRALLLLAARLEQAGESQEALDLYRRVTGAREIETQAERAVARLELVLEAAAIGPPEELRARLEHEPDDHAARHGLALSMAAAGEHRAALELLLELVRRDRQWRDEAGRKTMLRVFEMVGARSTLADEFRERLSRTLY